MLVLTDSDSLRLDLDKLRERILYSPRDRCGTSLSYVESRELLRSELACRVHARARLVGDHVRNLLGDLAQEFADNLLRLSRSRSVSYRDEGNLVL